MSNREFSEVLNIPFSSVLGKRMELGLKKMNMEYWTPIQVKWLKELYPHVGDLEISMMFNEAYPKEKGWTLKHIEKKRLYLGLRRTKKMLTQIRERNRMFGSWAVGIRRSKETIGVARVGSVKDWGGRLYEKTEAGYQLINRIVWERHYGKIPDHMNVVRVDPFGRLDDIKNLQLLTNAELAVKNSTSRCPAELKETMKLINQLNNAINEKQDHRLKQSSFRAA